MKYPPIWSLLFSLTMLTGCPTEACHSGSAGQQLASEGEGYNRSGLEGGLEGAPEQAILAPSLPHSPTVGGKVTAETIDASDLALTAEDLAQLETLGFVADARGVLRREAELLDEMRLVYSVLPEMPNIDCIAISSIDRRDGLRPYLYDTLIEVFREFPKSAQINIMVGNSDVDYLSDRRLLDGGIHPKDLGRLHVWPADPKVSSFLRDVVAASVHLQTKTAGQKRAKPREFAASWNYSRALRNYRGLGGLLLMEDDITWARHAPRLFSRALAAEPLPIISLFNHRCEQLPLDPTSRRSSPRGVGTELVIQRPRMSGFDFWCTQAMYYQAAVARHLGEHVQMQMHRAGYDKLISEYMQAHAVQVGYAFPSLVQHVGRRSSVETHWFPESKCMVSDLSPAWPPEAVAGR